MNTIPTPFNICEAFLGSSSVEMINYFGFGSVIADNRIIDAEMNKAITSSQAAFSSFKTLSKEICRPLSNSDSNAPSYALYCCIHMSIISQLQSFQHTCIIVMIGSWKQVLVKWSRRLVRRHKNGGIRYKIEPAGNGPGWCCLWGWKHPLRTFFSGKIRLFGR